VADGTPFCNDRDCCDLVCELDPFCCSTSWDSICANEATLFPQCPCFQCPKSDHNCFTEGVAGCTDPACCETVCAIDPFCCTNSWDGLCVSEAIDLCDGCGDPNANECCEASPNDTPFCNERDCCEVVCAADPFCCNTEWDSICANAALLNPACGCSPCGNADHNCFTQGDPGCSDATCCATVCAQDLFCCTTAWDSICVDEASDLCNGCGDPDAGNCFLPDNSPFCDDRDCCDAVCAIDPFCCSVTWDGICANEAIDMCCPADINKDQQVDVDDLLAVISDWGCAVGCVADINKDGAVDVNDLLIVIGGWGACPAK
jgi:hypothetical protein